MSEREYCPATSARYGRCYGAPGHDGGHANAAGCWDTGRVTAPVWERAVAAGAGDRPPAPSLHTLIDYALDEIVWAAALPGDRSDEIAEHRAAIHDAVRAVRPTPRAALTVERLAALLKLLAHTAEISPRTYEAEAAWLLPRLGVSRGAPTPAMIAAAQMEFLKVGEYEQASSTEQFRMALALKAALRAALTAQEDK